MGVLSRVACDAQQSVAIIRVDHRADVGAESGVGPAEHRGSGVLVEPAVIDEPCQHGALPRRFEHGRIVRGRGDERPVIAERAVGQEYVEVGMPVGERTETLVADDRAGGSVRLAKGGTHVLAQRAVGNLAQLAEPPAIVEEVGAQRTRANPCSSRSPHSDPQAEALPFAHPGKRMRDRRRYPQPTPHSRNEVQYAD